MKKIFVSIICCVTMACAAASAQPGMGGGFPMGGPMGGPGMMMGGAVDMKEFAALQTDNLSRELGLTEQQYKKVLKITKKELDRRVNHYLSTGGSTGGFGGFGGGFPMGGPGMGGPMGGPGMGGPMGGPGMNQNENGSGESAALRQAQSVYDRMEQMEQTKADLKAKIKIEKKMAKILTQEQYAKWVEIQSRPKPARTPRMNGGRPDFENMPEEARQRMMERMQQGGQNRPGAGPGGDSRRR